MRLTNKLVFLVFLVFFSHHSFAEKTKNQIISSDTYQIGLMVQAVQRALQVRDEQALQTISLYGTDSRYYSMIRGWLFQELVGVESQLHASKNKINSEKFQAKSNFLKKTIILVDLE